MKFNRLALQDAARTAIDAMRREHEDAYAAECAAFEEKKTAWVDEHGEGWLAACKTIAAKIRKGQPVLDDDMPSSPGHRRVYFYERAPRKAEFRQPRELVELIAVLNVVADDEVTTTGLHAVGMTRTAVATAVRHLRAGQAKA